MEAEAVRDIGSARVRRNLGCMQKLCHDKSRIFFYNRSLQLITMDESASHAMTVASETRKFLEELLHDKEG